MLKVRLQTRLTDEAMEGAVGRYCTEQDAGILVSQDCSVYKPDGSLLLRYLRGAIFQDVRDHAWPALRSLESKITYNRGNYGASERREVVRADGSVRKQETVKPISSAIIGYMDRQGGRFPYCRATAFTAQEVERWQEVVPLVGAADRLFWQHCPDRHAAQRDMLTKSVKPFWVIANTAFTTVTVNNNVVAGVHKDKGDYEPGFGVISCFRDGDYTGGLLCFPQYRVAVDLQDRDVIFFDPHEWHGMTPIEGEGNRVTCVFYAREKMARCGTPEEEMENARRARGAIA